MSCAGTVNICCAPEKHITKPWRCLAQEPSTYVAHQRNISQSHGHVLRRNHQHILFTRETYHKAMDVSCTLTVNICCSPEKHITKPWTCLAHEPSTYVAHQRNKSQSHGGVLRRNCQHTLLTRETNHKAMEVSCAGIVNIRCSPEKHIKKPWRCLAQEPSTYVAHQRNKSQSHGRVLRMNRQHTLFTRETYHKAMDVSWA